MNYYNEFDPFASSWLRELIKEKLIPEGEVDDRSITDVLPGDLKGYTQCHFFAGIGGWSYALQLAGWPTTRPVWTGSCPCQPFSTAGTQKGKSDERHLWPVWFNLIREGKPATIFGEQVASAIAHGWLDDVYQGLESEGYACGAAVLPACSVGAPHKRDRLWFVADTINPRPQGHRRFEQEPVPQGWKGAQRHHWQTGIWINCPDGKQRLIEPSIRLLDNGIPNRVGKLRGYGNAIVPQVASEFISAYLEV